ncbi:MAG: ATP-binding protein, partial [bacterium]
VNKAVEDNTGLKAEEIAGRRFYEVFPSWEGEDTRELVSRALETGELYSNDRVRYRAPVMDREAVFNIKIRPITDKPGVILGAVVLFEFMADKVLLEEHMLRVNEELQRANIVKSEFLSMVSHELRTPLTLIKMYSAMLAERKIGPLNEKQGKAVEVLNRRCKNLNDLIDDLLDLSRVESGKMELHLERVSLAELIEESAAVYRPRAEIKGLEFIVESEPGLTPVLADRDKTSRTLNNLIENALKFTETGHIGIKLGGDETSAAFARVTVSDTGIGIPEEYKDRVFERFFQVDGTDTRRHGGSGLGLAIARDLMSLHGGRLWLERTAEGEGSSFSFCLPYYDAEKAEQMKMKDEYAGDCGLKADSPGAAGAVSARIKVTGPPSILLVDDDRDFLDMMHDLLTDSGFNVYPVADGIAALNELFSDKRIDIILLDITMPKISGYEVCRAIKSFDATRGIPVLMLTAAGQSDQITRGYEAGAAGYLVKPFEPDILKRTLIHLMEGKQNGS